MGQHGQAAHTEVLLYHLMQPNGRHARPRILSLILVPRLQTCLVPTAAVAVWCDD
jgi:hypothetical protein